MYASSKREDGTYGPLSYVKRAFELVNFKILHRYIRDYIPEYGFFKRIGVAIDYYWCLIRYGAIVCDYFEYEFWKKRACVRKEYVTMKMNKKVKKVFNCEKKGVFRNKMLFNQIFAKHRDLECFDLRDDSFGETEFLDFVKACNRNIIAKPYTGYSGIGIHKPDVSTDELAISVYNQLKKNGDFFCEEAFVQTGVLSEINPASVNTLRIYTLFDGEKVHITFCTVRFGGGADVVDNIHKGGMCCEIDMETGIVIGPGYNLRGEKFYYHPKTNKLVLGIQIPNWDKVIARITEAASMFKEQGHVAWDIAVSNEKVSIIEGNDGGNFDLPQIACQRGCKSLYKDFIKARKKSKTKS